MPQKRKSSPLFTMIVTVIGAVAGSIAVSSFFNKSTTNISTALEQASTKINKTVPLMVDAETRLDSTATAGDKTLIYRYTLVNMAKADGSVPPELATALRPMIVNEYRTNAGLKNFRAAGVTMRYQYSDKQGVYLFEVVVGPADLQ